VSLNIKNINVLYKVNESYQSMMFKMKLTMTHFAVFAAIVGVALALIYYKVSSTERSTNNKLKDMESHMMSIYASIGGNQAQNVGANAGDVCYAAVPPQSAAAVASTHPTSGAFVGGLDDDNYSVTSEDVKDILSSLDEAAEGTESFAPTLSLGGETAPSVVTPESAAMSINEYETELKKKSVEELKTMLKEHNESTKGTKYELIKRLVQLGDAVAAAL
jgi:hypothetical protein